MWQHEIIKTLTVLKFDITNVKLNNKYICSNISKTEYLKYIKKVFTPLNNFLNRKSNQDIKGEIQEQLTCESNP